MKSLTRNASITPEAFLKKTKGRKIRYNKSEVYIIPEKINGRVIEGKQYRLKDDSVTNRSGTWHIGPFEKGRWQFVAAQQSKNNPCSIPFILPEGSNDLFKEYEGVLLDPVCECGAESTDNPNHHYSWCPKHSLTET